MGFRTTAIFTLLDLTTDIKYSFQSGYYVALELLGNNVQEYQGSLIIIMNAQVKRYYYYHDNDVNHTA